MEAAIMMHGVQSPGANSQCLSTSCSDGRSGVDVS